MKCVLMFYAEHLWRFYKLFTIFSQALFQISITVFVVFVLCFLAWIFSVTSLTLSQIFKNSPIFTQLQYFNRIYYKCNFNSSQSHYPEKTTKIHFQVSTASTEPPPQLSLTKGFFISG